MSVGVLWAVLLSAAAQGETPTRVTLVVAGDEARTRAFTSSLRELLARLSLSLDTRELDAGQANGAELAAVEADFTIADECRLTVLDELGRTVLVRRLGRSGTPSLEAEVAAHVVQSVMEELISATKWKPPVADPVPLAQPPLEQVDAPVAVAPKKKSTPWSLELGGMFGGRSFLNGASITAGGGLTVTVGRRIGNFRPTLSLQGDYHAPFEMPNVDPVLTVGVQTMSARLLASLDLVGDDAYRIDASVGGGADVFFITPQSDLIPSSSLKRRAEVTPVLTVMMTGRLGLASSVDLYLGLACDFDLYAPRFVSRVGPMDTEKLWEPLVVRPSLVLGFSFNVAGHDPYSVGE